MTPSEIVDFSLAIALGIVVVAFALGMCVAIYQLLIGNHKKP